MKNRIGISAVMLIVSTYLINTGMVLAQSKDSTDISEKSSLYTDNTIESNNNELKSSLNDQEIKATSSTEESSSRETISDSQNTKEQVSSSEEQQPTTTSTIEETQTSERTSESDKKEEKDYESDKKIRTISADGFVEVSSLSDLKKQIEQDKTNGTTDAKIRITQPLVFSEDITINNENLTLDWGGLEHDFQTKHVYISNQVKKIEFKNFKGTAMHPGGLTSSINTNAIIRTFSTDWLGNKSYFTGTLTFTGTLDLYNGSKLGLVYAPRAIVTMDGVSGIIDLQPQKTGLSADPRKAYFCRSYQLNIINGSVLTGPYLGKFYGNLGESDETFSGNSNSGLRILDGSKVSLDYARADNVEDEGEAIDTLPSNVSFEVSGEGSEFRVKTQINITKDSNRGIIQMRGSGSKVLVSDGAKISINSSTTGAFRLEGNSSQINVSSGGQIDVTLVHDADQPGNNGMRFVGKGLSLSVDGAGSLISIEKKSGKSSAIRFENGTQKMSVTNGGSLKVHNVGDGHEYASKQNQGNQAIQFYDSSGFLESPGSADFIVSGEKSNIDIRADSGATIETTGDVDLNFNAFPKTYMVMIGKTGQKNTGIISGNALNVSIDSPTYFDFQNRRVGSASSDIGGWIFQGNGESSLKIANSETALWRRTGAIFNNFDKDPSYFSNLGDLSVTGTDLGKFSYSSDAGLMSEFNDTANGMKSYNRISANNQVPIVDNLRVPTNADKKIYGHISVPEGITSKPRDAWNKEVEVTLRITYADSTKESVDIKALTKGQGDSSISSEAGYNPWGEGEQGGLFEVTVPDGKLLSKGDKVQVVSAKKVKGNHIMSELETQKTTVDVIPPEPASITNTVINAATNSIQGTGAAGSTAILIKEDKIISQVIVDELGKFKLSIPYNSLTVGDTLYLVLNDNAGDASEKGVINKPSTNNDLGNQNPIDQAINYHDAPTFQPGILISVEGGLNVSVPDSIDFGTIEATGITQEKKGNLSEDDSKLIVYDQRESKGQWTLTISLDKPLTNVDDETISLTDALYFTDMKDNDHLLSAEEILVTEGINKNNAGVDYSSNLKEGAAFTVVLDKKNQIIGKYVGGLRWTLSDVPTE